MLNAARKVKSLLTEEVDRIREIRELAKKLQSTEHVSPQESAILAQDTFEFLDDLTRLGKERDEQMAQEEAQKRAQAEQARLAAEAEARKQAEAQAAERARAEDAEAKAAELFAITDVIEVKQQAKEKAKEKEKARMGAVLLKDAIAAHAINASKRLAEIQVARGLERGRKQKLEAIIQMITSSTYQLHGGGTYVPALNKSLSKSNAEVYNLVDHYLKSNIRMTDKNYQTLVSDITNRLKDKTQASRSFFGSYFFGGRDQSTAGRNLWIISKLKEEIQPAPVLRVVSG